MASVPVAACSRMRATCSSTSSLISAFRSFFGSREALVFSARLFAPSPTLSSASATIGLAFSARLFAPSVTLSSVSSMPGFAFSNRSFAPSTAFSPRS